ncbi:mannose-ethanolamine phosphotransferase gpi13 [Microsporum canis]|uniref:Phosphoethanolamine transferase class O n=1 Tax=Arthroderma otae (strain ATCC MYA-4605 / CBS 113480) TaxID=554155 RepID=C5FKW5_ARTOC|nr:phosphoethanolamine transferase class O [Microsporum canis CBS 113480]EEQ30337.1 phosphoethanolamine transferase class O [Microsporum canis CBS 113480]
MKPNTSQKATATQTPSNTNPEYREIKAKFAKLLAEEEAKRAAGPEKPTQRAKRPAAGQSELAKRAKEQDAKRNKEKENAFKIQHIGILLLLGWFFLVHVIGIYFFTKGFLLTRLVLEDISQCDVLPLQDDSDVVAPANLGIDAPRDGAGKGCWHAKTFDKAVVIIIDALRYDFTIPFQKTSEGQTPRLFHDNIPVFYDTAVKSPNDAFLLPFIADPPTTTLQRLKGLTTGTLPTFIDAGSNFAGTTIDEDNIIAQLKTAGKRVVHLGDDTWHSLFPGYFEEELTHAYDSFNVWDLFTVDNGVTEHIFPLLHADNSTKWDVLIGHYLGVDHAGHRYGPDHPAMADKLAEMDALIRKMMEAIDDKTLLVVMGDHGMDPKGDHGGESDDEVEAALWMYSKKGIFGRVGDNTLLPPVTAKERPIPQIDLVPTLSLLLGLPIPFNNLGSPIEEAFAGKTGQDFRNLATVNRLASAQIKRYQHEYSKARGSEAAQTSGPLAQWAEAEQSWKDINTMGQSDKTGYQATYNTYREYQRLTLSVCKGLWAKFDIPSMAQGVAILFAGVTLLLYYARAVRGNRTDITYFTLRKIGYGSLVGIGGAATINVGLALEMPILESAALGCVTGGIIAAASMVFQSQKTVGTVLPKSIWGWAMFVFTIAQSVGFASNSYTIWEDQILLFFLTTFGVFAAFSSLGQKATQDRVLGFYHSVVFVLLGRAASMSRLCREEQMPYCESTYYASNNSSTSAPWQLLIPFFLSLLLPAVIRSYYQGTKSYEGSAIFWIGFAFRMGLLIVAIYWALDAADDGNWFAIQKEHMKSARTILAQVVLAIAFAAGSTTFAWAKPCVSIGVTPNGSQSGEAKTSVTILGYANIYGTRYFLLLVNFTLAIILLQKPMGGGAVGLQIWQILSLMEILDTNNLTVTNSATGPVVLALLGSFHYFTTGHQATLSSIQWETAFIPLKTVQYPWSPILVTLNTFGPQILSALAVPLTVLWKRPIESRANSKLPTNTTTALSPTPAQGDPQMASKQSSPVNKLLSDVAQATATHMLYYATISLATTMWAGWLRRHLMLYRIFCPRFMMGAGVLAVVDIVVICLAVGGVRWSTISVGEVFGWA